MTSSMPRRIAPSQRIGSTLIDAFTSATPWTVSGGTAAFNQTGLPVDSAVKFTTDGSATLIQAERTCVMDAKNHFFSFWVLPDAKTARLDFGLMAGSSVFNTSSFARVNVMVNGTNPAIHHFRPGTWTHVTIPTPMLVPNGSSPPEEAAIADIRGIHLGVMDDGTGPSTVHIADLRVHINPFPPGVIWTFDDARLDTYTKAYPILAAEGFVGNVGVPTALVGSAVPYDHMTWANLLDLHGSGWELVNHTRDHTNLSGVSAADAESAIRSGRADLNAQGLPDNRMLILPGGGYDSTTLPVIEAETLAARSIITNSTSANGPNYETPQVNDRGRLRTTYVLSGTSTVNQVKAVMDRLVSRGGQAFLTFHSIADTNPGSDAYTWLTADFQTLVDYAVSLGLMSYRMSDLFMQPRTPAARLLAMGLL